MADPAMITRVTEMLRETFGDFRYIQSAYLYGSVLTDAYLPTSDIDVLFIVADGVDRSVFLRELKAARGTVKKFKLDINVVFQHEFARLWHIYRPPTYFIWIKWQSILLWGSDCLRDISDKAITPESIYKRAVDLAQGSRSVYLNDKDVFFWEKKYTRWLRELACGILYLEGTLELDLRRCAEKLGVIAPELKTVKLLQKKYLPIKTISKIAELLVVFMQGK